MENKHATQGYLSVKTPLPGLNDPEGGSPPSTLGRVIDAHVHIFPAMIFNAVWEWFEKYGWPIRYKLSSKELLEFLFSRGIDHVVAFQYAHKEGMAEWLNEYMAKKVAQFQGKLTGMATVFPGEGGAEEIVRNAFEKGLKGIKLHVHVQCFDMVSQEMKPIYRLCEKMNQPMVIHAGREPNSPAYSCDPYRLCSADRVEEVVKHYPGLKLCVPHLGMDEFERYRILLEQYDNLWVDTAVAITDYLPMDDLPDFTTFRQDRILYGSDFPNIPYAWDRELKVIADRCLSKSFLERITYKNAMEFFSISSALPASHASTEYAQPACHSSHD